MNVIYDLLEKVNLVGDEDFPDWLFNSTYNDFEDNYYDQSFAESELVSEIKKMRRRYNDFFDYMDAIDIYNEYMEAMVNKYGSMRTIKNALEVNLIEDPIPAKPKLKATKKNKLFLQSGVIPSRKTDTLHLDGEEIRSLARKIQPDKDGSSVDEADMYKKLPKDVKEELKRASRRLSGETRKQNMYRTVGNNRGTDFIVEFLNNAKNGVYSSHQAKKSTDDSVSIIDIAKDIIREKTVPPELLEDENSISRTVVYGNRLVNTRDKQQIEIYKQLLEEGFDVMHQLGHSGLDKKSVKMIRNGIGATEPMTKKEMKKMKKRTKKEAAKIKRRADASEVLQRTILGNKLDLDDSSGMLNLRLKDIAPDE